MIWQGSYIVLVYTDFLLASSHCGPSYPAWQLQVLLPTHVPFRQGGSQTTMKVIESSEEHCMVNLRASQCANHTTYLVHLSQLLLPKFGPQSAWTSPHPFVLLQQYQTDKTDHHYIENALVTPAQHQQMKAQIQQENQEQRSPPNFH